MDATTTAIKLAATDSETGVAELRRHAPQLEAPELAEGLQAVFEEEWACRFEREEPLESELEVARQRAGHYTSKAFVHRR